MSTFFVFSQRCLFQSCCFFPHDKTISPMKTATRHFYFFYFSKKIALCTSLHTLQWTWTCERPAEEPRAPPTSLWLPAAATGRKHFHRNRTTLTTEPEEHSGKCVPVRVGPFKTQHFERWLAAEFEFLKKINLKAETGEIKSPWRHRVSSSLLLEHNDGSQLLANPTWRQGHMVHSRPAGQRENKTKHGMNEQNTGMNRHRDAFKHSKEKLAKIQFHRGFDRQKL